MSRTPRFDHLGIGVIGSQPRERIVGYAVLAEQAGLGSFWMAEGFRFRSTPTLLGLVARATRRVRIGTGVLSVFSRHPATLAAPSSAAVSVAPWPDPWPTSGRANGGASE